LKPDQGKYYNGFGYFLYSQDRYREAESIFRKYVQLEPNDSNSHYFFGLNQLYLEKYVEAEKELCEVIRLGGRRTQYLIFLGRCLDKQGKRKEARIYWEEAYTKIDKMLPEMGRDKYFEEITSRLAEPD